MKNLLMITLFILSFIYTRSNQYIDSENKNAKMIFQWKLIEYLDLDEEQSSKFFIMINDFKKEKKELNEANKVLIENIQNLIENDKIKNNDVDDLVNKFFDYQDKIHELKREHHQEVHKVLNSEQVLKYLIFDKKFKKGLKDKLRNKKKDFRSY